MKTKMNFKRSIGGVFGGLVSKEQNKLNPAFFALTAAVGICAGVCLEALNNDVYTSIGVDYVDYFTENSAFLTWQYILNYFICNIAYIIVPVFCGMSIVGFPFLYFVPFIKGIGLGAVSGYIYSVDGIKGVAESLLCIIPSGVILIFGIMLACNESFLMSRDIGEIIINKKENEEISMKLFILRYSVILLILAISALFFAGGIIISRLIFVEFSA